MNTAYDVVTYPNRSYPQTRPDRLAVLSELFGLSAAPPERCRVLELGCGNGANLFPQAYAFPESRFVGMDLAPTLILAGQQIVRDLGLSNVELHQADLADFPVTGEPFDYIVAHGIYSWVPPKARDGLLAICRGRLAPQGTAFVSYNCLPGCHVRQMVREIMQFHIRQIQKPEERVRQAVAVCQLIANSIEKPDTYRQVFKDQLEQIHRHSAGHLFHDDLAEINDPCYFHEFMAHAAGHGLQFLAEADFFEMQNQVFTPEVREVLGRMEDSRLTHEQYLDFIKCRRFRQTLLCHHEATLQVPPDSKPVERLHISSEASLDPAASKADNPAVERFVEPRGAALEVDYPPAKAAFNILRQNWPATLSFEDIFNAVVEKQPIGSFADATRVRSNLAAILLEAYRVGIVNFYRAPIRCVPKPSAKPCVWQFARWQAARSDTVSTLRGENLRVEDNNGLRLLQLVDGSRTVEELRQAMEEGGAPGYSHDGNEATRIEKRLDDLARMALLES